jgi:hypothetical protein
MTLAVFQVGTDVENSQLLDADIDPSLWARPANGESVAGRSWPSTLTVFDPQSPRSSFYYLHESFLVMDGRSMLLCRSALEGRGEFVPLSVADVGTVYMYNPWTTLSQDAVDWSKTKGKLGVYSNLTLNKDLIPPVSIFRLPKMSSLYLSSELRDDEDDFLYLYRKYGLSGLYFKKLWDESAGAVPNRSSARGSHT